MLRMLALERNPRNRALLRLLYLGGLRISELCELRVRDLVAREDALVRSRYSARAAKPGRCF